MTRLNSVDTLNEETWLANTLGRALQTGDSDVNNSNVNNTLDGKIPETSHDDRFIAMSDKDDDNNKHNNDYDNNGIDNDDKSNNDGDNDKS